MMATIRGCKNQLTRAINNLQQGLNQYDQVPLDSNGIENEPPNTRLRRIAERKIDLIAAKSRLEDLLLELQTKFQAAVDFAQRAPINPDSIPPVEEIDNHWVEHNGEEIEENARKALSVIKATYRQLEVLEASASLEIQYHIGSPHSVPPTTQIRREAAAAPDTPPPGFENTPRRILSSTNVVLNHPQEFSQPQPMHNGSVSSQQIDATMILPSQLQKLEIEPYYGDIARLQSIILILLVFLQDAAGLPRPDLIQKYAAFAVRRTIRLTDVGVICLYDNVAAFKVILVVTVECKVVSAAVEITTSLSVITGTADVIHQVHFVAQLTQKTIEDKVERSTGRLVADILQESRPTMVKGPVIHHLTVVVVLTIDIDRGLKVTDAYPSILQTVCHQILVEYHLQIQSGTNPHPSIDIALELVDLNGKTLNFTMNTKERLTAPHNTAPVTKEDALAILSLGIEVNPVRSTVNKVQSIRSIIDKLKEKNIATKFHYVQTEDNPADCATRGLKIKHLQRPHLVAWAILSPLTGTTMASQPNGLHYTT
ncbi:hypothetical protein ANCCEY_09749 [Ancylostoma ceylanicum]|uniref:Uncharacterized protein n=1 Tax=Ancylostoma ceylanicum TaxID=53326 RepID=A0A0D6LIX4_9BILA|nr:hypothetical protein ANCCEY_09749 [Ancylostoma ceylanicum]